MTQELSTDVREEEREKYRKDPKVSTCRSTGPRIQSIVSGPVKEMGMEKEEKIKQSCHKEIKKYVFNEGRSLLVQLFFLLNA